MAKFDLSICAGRFMPLANGSFKVQRDVILHASAGRIEAIEALSSQSLQVARESTHFIDASEKLVMPGLVNAHMHLPMSLLRGIAEDVPFQQWIYETILPIEGKLLNPEMARVGAELALLESLRSGVTTVADMYYFEDDIADVADRVGVRGLFAFTAMDQAMPDSKGASGFVPFLLERMLERFTGHARIRPAIGPHAPYTCSDETLLATMRAAEKHSLPVMMHVSETELEVVEHRGKHGGLTPPERLHRLGFLKLAPIFAHGVHLTDSDMELIAQSGTSVIYNPESNMKLSSGAARIARLKAAGVKLGIGTDGAASNNDLDLFREMDSGVKLQRLAWKSATDVEARDMLKMATFGGAESLGLEREIGSLEVGKRADLIVLDLSIPELQPLYDVPSQLVYSAASRAVDTVICDGRVLIDKGQPTTIDVGRLLEAVEREADRVRRLLGKTRA